MAAPPTDDGPADAPGGITGPAQAAIVLALAFTVLLATVIGARDTPPMTDPPPPGNGAAPPVIETSPPLPGEPLIVADPRPGDLRTDPDADTLPATYRPAAPARTVSDAAYGSDPEQLLDLHLPAGADADTPVLLYLHSGGWIGGGKAGIPDMIMRFVEEGYVLASANYRLAPEHPFPAAVEDVHRAIRWLRSYGDAEAVFDGDRMVLVGASAGGYLAAFAAASEDRYLPNDLPAPDSGLVGVVSFVGPTDLVQLYDQPHEWARGLVSAFVGCDPCTDEQLSDASVAPYLHADLPPAYWAYGGEDGLVDATLQGAAIARAWATRAGSRASWLDVVDGGGHDLDESEVNVRALDVFLDEVAGAPAS